MTWPGTPGDCKARPVFVCMHHRTADKLVYMHEIEALLARKQDAGYSPECEKHESDSDSDHSDLECDLDEEKLQKLMC